MTPISADNAAERDYPRAPWPDVAFDQVGDLLRAGTELPDGGLYVLQVSPANMRSGPISFEQAKELLATALKMAVSHAFPDLTLHAVAAPSGGRRS